MAQRIVLHQLGGEHRFLGINEAGDKAIVDGEQPAAGVKPMQMLLIALASCTAFDVVDIMAKKRQPLARYRIEVIGEQAEAYPRRYTQITLVHYGSGPQVTEAALARSADLSRTKYCSVSASLNAEIVDQVIVEPWDDPAADQA